MSQLEARLLRYLREITPPTAVELTSDSEIGRPLSPRTFDIKQEWTRVSGIVKFIERER